MSQSVSAPPPRFSVRVARSCSHRWRLGLPIGLYFGRDGDCTNQLLWFGVEWMERGYGDALWSVGLDFVIPPRLFWLLKLLRISQSTRLEHGIER